MTKKDRQQRIIARGEHSGHSHVITGEAIVRNKNGEILIDVTGDATIRHLLESEWLKGREVHTGEHADIPLQKGTYKYVPQIEFHPYSETIQRVKD